MTWQEFIYKGLLGYWVEKSGASAIIWLLGFAVCAAAAYLLGSLNFAVIISKRKFHDDIRNYGSGNAGMTNMLRTYGKTAAFFTLLGDASKAAVSIAVGTMINGYIGAYAAGFFCILGHMFPLYYKFKGGKGVVTSAVMILMLDWRVFLVLFSVFALIVAATKFMSLGSIIGMLLYPLVLYNFNGPDFRILFAFAISALVIFMHRENIKRLYEGKESKISFGKKKPKPPEDEPKTPPEKKITAERPLSAPSKRRTRRE